MVRIEMLNDFGDVTEVCEATESERADETADSGAFCEDGEAIQERQNCDGPVYRWITHDGMIFQACRHHIEVDDFSRFATEES